jgi:hypothetical protein
MSNVADSFKGQPNAAPQTEHHATDAPVPGGHGSALTDAKAQGSSDQRDRSNWCSQSSGHPGTDRVDMVAPAGKGR